MASLHTRGCQQAELIVEEQASSSAAAAAKLANSGGDGVGKKKSA